MQDENINNEDINEEEQELTPEAQIGLGFEDGLKSNEEKPETDTETDTETIESNKEEETVDVPEDLEDRTKETQTGEEIKQWWDDLNNDHPDANTLLNSEEMRKWYETEATDAEKKLLEKGSSASDVSRALYKFKSWQSNSVNKEDNKNDKYIDTLRDVKIKNADGEETTLGAEMDAFGEDGKALFSIFNAMIENVQQKNDNLVKTINELKSTQEQADSFIQEQKFWTAVRGKHNDVDSLMASGKIEEYVKSKGEGFINLFNTGTAQDVVDIISSFKKEQIEKAAEEQKNVMQEKTIKKRTISKNLLSERKTTANNKTELSPEDEMFAGFEEGIRLK